MGLPSTLINFQTTVGLSNTVALDFGRAVLGPIGGVIFTAAVTISCFGAINCERFSIFSYQWINFV